MSRYLKWLVALLGGLIAAVVLAVVILSLVPLNWARPWISSQLSDAMQRDVQIEGDILLDWAFTDYHDGWRGLVPSPVINAKKVSVSNPEWARSGPTMAQAETLRLQVDPFGLAGRVVRLADLQIANGQLVLERQVDGSNNWTFGDETASDAEAGWRFVVERLMLVDASMRILDASRDLDAVLAVDTSQQDQKYGTRWTADGHFHGVEVDGEGQLGHVLSLQNMDEPFPVQGVLHVGATSFSAEGTVIPRGEHAAVDVQLELSGPTMADLYPILGVALPHTPPYRTAGHLKGDLNTEQGTWVYEGFTGTVGDSDLSGDVRYEQREPRPLLTAALHSELLRFEDLGPLIGAPGPDDTNGAPKKDALDRSERPPVADSETAPKVNENENQGQLTESGEQPDGKVLPVQDADQRLWATMDADVTFEGRRIESTINLPLDDVRAHVVLDDSVLRFDPLDFGVAGGSIESTITLDGNSEPIQAALDAEARGLQLNQLFPGVESMDAALGSVHGGASLNSHGGSVSELMAHADGELTAVVSRGTVSQFLLEAAGLNVANMVFVKLFGDEQVTVQCLAADFGLEDGLMSTRTFVLETDDAVVTVAGTINLATEAMDLEIHPENKSVRVFTLRSPLYVAGTFSDPDVGVQPGPVAARAGAAVALGVVATPLAALLPLLNVGTDDETSCAFASDEDVAQQIDEDMDDDGRLKGSVEGANASD